MEDFKFGKIVRVITIAPIMALLMLTIVYIMQPDTFLGTLNYMLAVVFLTLLPILAYPIQPIIPKFKDQGREGQRHLAIIMAVIGYVLGIISAICMNVPKELMQIYLTYSFSGLLILIFNKGFKIRASGHACGVAGPIAILVSLLGNWFLISIIVLALVYWVSLRMKRHTISDLLWGTIIAVASLLISILVTA